MRIEFKGFDYFNSEKMNQVFWASFANIYYKSIREIEKEICNPKMKMINRELFKVKP